VSNQLLLTAGTFDPGNFIHLIAGPWNDSAVTFTPVFGTIRLTSATPNITAGGTNNFYNFAVNNGGTLLSAIDVDNDLTISGGTLNANDNDLTVTRHVGGGGTLAGAAGVPQETITVGGNFSPGGFIAGDSIVVLDTAAAGNLGGHTFYDLTINKAAPATTVTSIGALAVINTLNLTQGTWDAAGLAHSIQVPWDATSANFNFTFSTSTINMNATPGITINNRVGNEFWNLRINTAVNLSSAIVVNNDLTIDGGGTLDVTASNYQITVARDWADNGVFDPRTGWVVIGGAAGSSINTDETFYNLRKDAAGTTTLSANVDLRIRGELHIQTGILTDAAGANTITMGDPPGGSAATTVWTNDVGAAGFAAVDIDVIFDSENLNHTLFGATTFDDFTVSRPNSVLTFERFGTGGGPYVVNGTFDVNGLSGQEIILKSDDPGIASGFPPGPQPEHWVLTINGTATISFVKVTNSWATIAVTPGLGSVADPPPVGGNYNWFFFIPVKGSWTIDSDNNGRIDRIRVQVLPGTQLSDNFSVKAAVTGYQVTGYATADDGVGGGDLDDVFDILLAEGDYLDTGARPRWQLTENNAPYLFGLVGGALLEFGSKTYTADDGARPVIGYTLAVAGGKRAYLYFSERVWSDAAATVRINAADFTYSAINPFTLTVLNPSANGTREAMLEFTAALNAADILLPETIVAADDDITNPPNPAVYDKPYLDTAGMPAPNPASFLNVNLDGHLPFPDKPMYTSGAKPTVGPILNVNPHNISDVGLNIVRPIWASDQTTVRDPVRGGIGRINDFDGSEWLQDLDISLQALVQAPPPWKFMAATLYYDIDATDPVRLHDLWLPVITAEDNAHNPNTAARSAAGVSTGAVRNFVIPADDAEIQGGVEVEFVIELGGFPFADVADPEDPRTARPWSYSVKDIRIQRAGITVLDNVISPDNGESVKLHYVTEKAGLVTVQVFDLEGDLIDVLFRGSQAAGEYSTTWDGTNRTGRVVARGVYFISVVAPDINEIRKVLVVK
jgi:hypothetical protein